jgi:hypothetical protein
LQVAYSTELEEDLKEAFELEEPELEKSVDCDFRLEWFLGTPIISNFDA